MRRVGLWGAVLIILWITTVNVLWEGLKTTWEQTFLLGNYEIPKIVVFLLPAAGILFSSRRETMPRRAMRILVAYALPIVLILEEVVRFTGDQLLVMGLACVWVAAFREIIEDPAPVAEIEGLTTPS